MRQAVAGNVRIADEAPDYKCITLIFGVRSETMTRET
jgi:hypothetical protein